MASLVCLFLASCNDDDKQTFEVVSLSGLGSESGPGNVLLKWDRIESDGVAYVEISYTSGDEVDKKILVNSQYSEKLIYGFGNEDTYTFMVNIRMKDGQKSDVQTISESPKKPAFIDFQSTVVTTTDFGGINVKWDNLSGEKFYINVEYTNDIGITDIIEIDVIETGEGKQFVEIAGVLNVDLNIYVSDVVGNTTSAKVYAFKKLEKGKFDRSIWEFIVYPSQWAANTAPGLMLDGKPATAWHSVKGGHGPVHHFAFDLKRKVKIEKIEAQHRPNSVNVGSLILFGNNDYTGAQEFVAAEWTSIDTLVMLNGKGVSTRKVINTPMEYRYVWVKAMTIGGNGHGVLAEFALYGEDIVEQN